MNGDYMGDMAQVHQKSEETREKKTHTEREEDNSSGKTTTTMPSDLSSEKHQYTRTHAHSAYKHSTRTLISHKNMHAHIRTSTTPSYTIIHGRTLTARNLPIYIYSPYSMHILCLFCIVLYCVLQRVLSDGHNNGDYGQNNIRNEQTNYLI